MILNLTMLKLSTVLFWIIPLSTSYTEDTARHDTLKLVQVIFRHGDRAPTNTYPNDPYNDIPKYWPEGMAQLTNRGKMQQYELGKYLRHRYDGYLGKTYSQKEIYTLCSDMDRTIMSLESNLAGLFPPVTRWDPKIDLFRQWQPIPLRTIPWKEDKFLHNNVRCPRYYQIRRDFISSSKVVQEMNEENAEFIRYCAQNSGLPAQTVKELYPLLDILYAQASHNFTLPKWVIEGNVLPKLIQLHSFVNTWPTYTDEMKRLWGGNLLNLLLKNMRAIAGHGHLGSKPGDIHAVSHGVNRKMLMYSAHDSTLSRIMNTMGIFEPQCPPYASAVIIELHQDPESFEYYVEYHYRNDTTRAPYLLTNEKCGYPCKLRDLVEIYNPLIPVDWERECRLDGKEPLRSAALKMSEHDDHYDEEFDEEDYEDAGDNEDEGFDWNQPLASCTPTVLQLVLMGIGFLAAAGLVALIIVKILQRRNGSFQMNIDSYGRPLFAGVHQQHKPYFYVGGPGYEKL